ncbi:DUF2795 domain-containing protein [Micromonospora aurantiaca (nom. illeg.)]|uniref:DUF2795 domain-containing protein n=1 Tax=Micromonospora aurantiaca (nom. illeg.) TaxID=47850 RepID=UPI0033C1DCFE
MTATPQDITSYLDDLELPVHRHDLIRHARTRNAGQETIARLRALPDIRFTTRSGLVNRLGACRRD